MLKVLLDRALVLLDLAVGVAETDSGSGHVATDVGLDFALELAGAGAGTEAASVLVPDPEGPESDVAEAGQAEEVGGAGGEALSDGSHGRGHPSTATVLSAGRKMGADFGESRLTRHP